MSLQLTESSPPGLTVKTYGFGNDPVYFYSIINDWVGMKLALAQFCSLAGCYLDGEFESVQLSGDLHVRIGENAIEFRESATVTPMVSIPASDFEWVVKYVFTNTNMTGDNDPRICFWRRLHAKASQYRRPTTAEGKPNSPLRSWLLSLHPVEGYFDSLTNVPQPRLEPRNERT